MARHIKGMVRGLFKPVVTFVLLITFFVTYNAYLVDASLETLRTSLDQTLSADTPGQVEGVGIMLEGVLQSELANPSFDFTSLNAVDVASSLANEALEPRQLKSSQIVMSEAVKHKESNRSGVLKLLDRINREVQKIWEFLHHFVLGLFQGKKNPPNPIQNYELLKQAKKLERSGKFVESEKLYDQFIRLNTNGSGIGLIKIRHAFILMKLGNYQKAKRLVSEVRQNVPNRTERVVLKNLSQQIKKMEKIAKKRKKLEREAMTLTRVEDLQEVYFQIGLLSAELYDLEGAQDAYKRVIDLDPRTEIGEKARFHLGFAYKLSNNIAESEKIFTQLGLTASTSELRFASQLQLASVKKLSGDYLGAAELLERLAGEATDVTTATVAQYNAGYIYLYNLNNPHKAQEAFERIQELRHKFPNAEIIEIDPFISVPLREFAFRLFELGELEKSKEMFETVLKVDENDAWAYCGLGVIHVIQGNGKLGFELTEKGYRLQPDYYTASALAYLEEGRGNLEEAIKLNKESIKFKGEYLYPYYNLSRVYITQKKYEESVEILKKGRDLAVNLDVAFPLLQNNLGYSYLQLKQYDLALEMFSEAILLDEGMINAWYNRALVYEIKGDMNSYRSDLQQVYALKSDYLDIKERLEKQAA